MTTKQRLTEDELFALRHCMMFGSTGYPVVKRGRHWFVDGIRGCGHFPCVFKTKWQAVASWEGYLDVLRDRYAGRS